jgi:hypothetical protein
VFDCKQTVSLRNKVRFIAWRSDPRR